MTAAPRDAATDLPVMTAPASAGRNGLLSQFGRYLVVGGAAFGADFGLLYLLTEFGGIHYLGSAAMAFLAGLMLNYVLSRAWVFDRRTLDSTSLEFLVFAGIGVIGLLLNEVILWAVVGQFQIHYLLAKGGSAGVVLVWNFGARRFLLFR
ncbi:MAG: GtrA family protein [Bryobacterales bacterium]|nr:GtrA family protein [Bryobacterales bacterium]